MNNRYRIHLSVPGYIRQGLKLLKATNTPVYYDTELFTAIKNGYSTGPQACTIRLFMVVVNSVP
jgi:hypothetical protein